VSAWSETPTCLVRRSFKTVRASQLPLRSWQSARIAAFARQAPITALFAIARWEPMLWSASVLIIIALDSPLAARSATLGIEPRESPPRYPSPGQKSEQPCLIRVAAEP
jgi:hypothetical protein